MPLTIIYKGGSKNGQQERSDFHGRLRAVPVKDGSGSWWTEFYKYESYDSATNTIVASYASKERVQ